MCFSHHHHLVYTRVDPVEVRIEIPLGDNSPMTLAGQPSPTRMGRRWMGRRWTGGKLVGEISRSG
jgi:hypothetical protein